MRPGLFPIELKERTRPTVTIDGVGYYFIGDAAQTSHFFTGKGVNVGLMQAEYLSRHLQGELGLEEYESQFYDLQQENRDAFRAFERSL